MSPSLAAPLASMCRTHGRERDVLIAATALERGMTVVTRNISDLASSGVELIDPWSA